MTPTVRSRLASGSRAGIHTAPPASRLAPPRAAERHTPPAGRGRRVTTLACTLPLLIGPWAGTARAADTACGPTSLQVAVPPLVATSHTIPVTWRVAPECAGIETGLLLGPAPTALAPAGQPIYASRERYAQTLLIEASGTYWVAAYVRDEAGRTVRSLPDMVRGLVPPPVLEGPAGSHGAPTSYTGTDADFLLPAGVPHFAALRHAVSTGETVQTLTTPHATQRAATGFRRLASTHPEEVRTQQGAPLPAGGALLTVSPGEVDRAIAALDEAFRLLAYPRPGLYTVDCAGDAAPAAEPRCRAQPFPFFGPFLGLGVGATELHHRLTTVDPQTGGPVTLETTASNRSTLTYYIPAAPPGRRVQRAQLSALAFAIGNPGTDVRLNGQAPVTVAPPCPPDERPFLPHLGFRPCVFFAAWDLTAEARALAAQPGGGLLHLRVDPVPAAFGRHAFNEETVVEHRESILLLWVDVNYPWRHGLPHTALTLTFEDDCSRTLQLSILRPVMRPVFPAFTATGGPRRGQVIIPVVRGQARNVPTETLVEAIAKTCVAEGETPSPVDVVFEVRAPVAGTADTAGHFHASHARPTGVIQESDREQATDRCTVRTFTDGLGSCTVRYRAGEVGGVETILARAAGFGEAQAQVTVRIPGLEDFRRFGEELWRFEGITPIHRDSHWASSFVISMVTLMAADYYELEQGLAVLRVNDMSLSHGGVFDLNADWQAPHRTHRQGTSVDFNTTACVIDPDRPDARCPAFKPLPRLVIEEICDRRDGRMENERQYHCEFPR